MQEVYLSAFLGGMKFAEWRAPQKTVKVDSIALLGLTMPDRMEHREAARRNMKTFKWSTAKLSQLAGLSAIAIIAAAGCGNKGDEGGEAGNTATGKSVDQNFRDTGGAVANAGDAAANTVAGAGNAVAGGVGAAGNAVAGAGKVVVNGAKNADDALFNTPKVKAALINNPAMQGVKGLDVTSSDKNVTISGTAKTAAQKTLAGKIVTKAAPGYKIINNIKVGK